KILGILICRNALQRLTGKIMKGLKKYTVLQTIQVKITGFSPNNFGARSRCPAYAAFATGSGFTRANPHRWSRQITVQAGSNSLLVSFRENLADDGCS